MVEQAKFAQAHAEQRLKTAEQTVREKACPRLRHAVVLDVNSDRCIATRERSTEENRQ